MEAVGRCCRRSCMYLPARAMHLPRAAALRSARPPLLLRGEAGACGVEEVPAVMLVVVVVVVVVSLVVPETAEDEEMRRLTAPLGAGEAVAGVEAAAVARLARTGRPRALARLVRSAVSATGDAYRNWGQCCCTCGGKYHFSHRRRLHQHFNSRFSKDAGRGNIAD